MYCTLISTVLPCLNWQTPEGIYSLKWEIAIIFKNNWPACSHLDKHHVDDIMSQTTVACLQLKVLRKHCSSSSTHRTVLLIKMWCNSLERLYIKNNIQNFLSKQDPNLGVWRFTVKDCDLSYTHNNHMSTAIDEYVFVLFCLFRLILEHPCL